MRTPFASVISGYLVLGLCLGLLGSRASGQTIECTAHRQDKSHVVISWNTVAARRYAVETKSSLMESWQSRDVLTATSGVLELAVPVEPGARFFRVAEGESTPPGMSLVPAGSFEMGDGLGEISHALPVHSVFVSAMLVDRFEVTKALWEEVHSWAITNEYSFDNAGGGKGTNHPVHTVNWYDVVKWCNARSEKEGRVPAYYTSDSQATVYRAGRVDVKNTWVKWDAGYRLPTEAEWEKGARGGVSGRRFPWGDTITWAEANYVAYPVSASGYAYDLNPTEGSNPVFTADGGPFTSPVGSFGANGYGLYDMTGNAWEWCWDSYEAYTGDAQVDPRGPVPDSYRVLRGGSWYHFAAECRVSTRSSKGAYNKYNYYGFRCVLPPGRP